ncbi:MAG: glycosyltransferase [Bacteroidales bacterium]|nr:glycosyltransferase [Bacteroidales bacterium]
MLTICIPVYNFDVTGLVRELLRQANGLDLPVEVLVFDDFSQPYCRKKNAALGQLPQVSYLEFDFNIGRSRIRNRLGDIASGEWLLFLDCDTMPESPDFLARYVQLLGQADVVYGGRVYGPIPQHRELMLRWHYGVRRECSRAVIRQVRPYKSFTSSNFVIKRELFLSARFNEALSGYGHEDTLLALDLKHRGVDIVHIDNPTVHLGLEPAAEFIEKATQGAHNLARILHMLPKRQRAEFERSVKLLRTFRISRRAGLLYPLRYVFRALPLIKRQLMGQRPLLPLFDLYVLSLLAQLYSKGWDVLREY